MRGCGISYALSLTLWHFTDWDDLAFTLLGESSESRACALRCVATCHEFDLNLNFIRLYNLKSNDPIYSKVFDIDSRQNIYFHSAEDGILYQRKNATQKAAKFIDYNLNSSSYCVSDIFINTDDQIGVLFDCMGELHTYGRSGRLPRKYKADLQNPVKIFFLNDDWAVINSDADIEFLNGSVRSLSIDKEVLVDAYLDRDRLLILTKTTIYVFDSSIISK